METMIIKRDGRLVPFDHFKIVDAVLAAFKEVDGEITDYALEKAGNIADYILGYCQNSENKIDVETIQDLVERGLMSTKAKKVAQAYIRFRYKKEVARQGSKEFFEAVKEKLNAENIQNQNANVDEASFGGRVGEASDVMMRKMALDYLVSDMAKNNHLNNEIYIHDLNSYYVGSHNCLSIPFDDLLANGFNTRQTDVRPAGSVNTAFQLVAVIFQLQSLQQFGGVSATHLDWTMVPYVRKSFRKHWNDGLKYLSFWKVDENDFEEEDLSITDYADYDDYKEIYNYAMDMTVKEVHQAVEGLYHNLNTLQSRSGNQLPFTSINYGTCTLPEGRMITKALLEVSLEGLGKLHKTSIFPCGIFQCMKGVNQEAGDPNYDLFQLALKSTAIRLYPNYANVDWSGNEGYDRNDPRTYFSTMGKRKLSSCKIF